MADIAALKPAMREGAIWSSAARQASPCTARLALAAWRQAIVLARGADMSRRRYRDRRGHARAWHEGRCRRTRCERSGGSRSASPRACPRFRPVRGIVHCRRAAGRRDDLRPAAGSPARGALDQAEGAENLAAATAKQPLDFFVGLFLCDHGDRQPRTGAYVAANAWLEGFARELRLKGVPALAIGWGAISDVASSRATSSSCVACAAPRALWASHRVSRSRISGRCWCSGKQAYPTQFYTNIAPSGAAEKLRLINAPTFAASASRACREKGEMAAILSPHRGQGTDGGGDHHRPRPAPGDFLHPPDAGGADRYEPTLGELGLDSLMALELQLAIERLCGTEIRWSARRICRLGEIAAGIFAKLGGEAQAEAGYSDLAQSMASMHGGGSLSAEDAAALSAELKTASSKDKER